VFHSKERADYHAVDVRHILVDTEEKANELLAQFNAGDKTEDAFAALASENSTDTGSSANGGLYENVYVGQMVKPFEDWCFDASRQAGDTGIVKTDYGYHVMYFVGRSDYAYWQTLAASKLGNEKMSALTENVSSESLDGMKYIDA
jgi:parvulin-like peptidyl-prolyl isomerase